MRAKPDNSFANYAYINTDTINIKF